MYEEVERLKVGRTTVTFEVKKAIGSRQKASLRKLLRQYKKCIKGGPTGESDITAVFFAHISIKGYVDFTF